ncbi:MAG: gamma-glutamylcyclotransferase family protein, partial [Myxococcota bacterium]
RLSPNDFERLDVHEGGYRRQMIQITDVDGQIISAQTYLHLHPERHRAPSAAYAAIIAHAYGQMGIDFAELHEALSVPVDP